MTFDPSLCCLEIEEGDSRRHCPPDLFEKNEILIGSVIWATIHVVTAQPNHAVLRRAGGKWELVALEGIVMVQNMPLRKSRVIDAQWEFRIGKAQFRFRPKVRVLTSSFLDDEAIAPGGVYSAKVRVLTSSFLPFSEKCSSPTPSPWEPVKLEARMEDAGNGESSSFSPKLLIPESDQMPLYDAGFLAAGEQE